MPRNLVVTGTNYANIPRLSWLAGKQFKLSTGNRKNRPGESRLHTAAIYEDASRSFAKEVDKALAPVQELVAEATPIPVVPVDAANEAVQL